MKSIESEYIVVYDFNAGKMWSKLFMIRFCIFISLRSSVHVFILSTPYTFYSRFTYCLRKISIWHVKNLHGYCCLWKTMDDILLNMRLELDIWGLHRVICHTIKFYLFFAWECTNKEFHCAIFRINWVSISLSEDCSQTFAGGLYIPFKIIQTLSESHL